MLAPLASLEPPSVVVVVEADDPSCSPSCGDEASHATMLASVAKARPERTEIAVEMQRCNVRLGHRSGQYCVPL
ncbi:MAG: hypothetical protein U0168_27890 [Nannocystaceae bacterium]